MIIAKIIEPANRECKIYYLKDNSKEIVKNFILSMGFIGKVIKDSTRHLTLKTYRFREESSSWLYIKELPEDSDHIFLTKYIGTGDFILGEYESKREFFEFNSIKSAKEFILADAENILERVYYNPENIIFDSFFDYGDTEEEKISKIIGNEELKVIEDDKKINYRWVIIDMKDYVESHL